MRSEYWISMLAFKHGFGILDFGFGCRQIIELQCVRAELYEMHIGPYVPVSWEV